MINSTDNEHGNGGQSLEFNQPSIRHKKMCNIIITVDLYKIKE